MNYDIRILEARGGRQGTHPAKWRHSNPRSRYDRHIVGKHDILSELSGEKLPCCSEKLNQFVYENDH